MSNSTISRRSPLLLVRNFIVIEIVALFVYFLASGHGDIKYEFYSRLFFSKWLSYETAKFLFLSITQLCITIFAFLGWHRKSDAQKFSERPDINQLMNRTEDEGVEFKSSLRFDHKIGAINRDLEKTAMKSIAAFLNSKGGYLVVGFDDKRQPVGIHFDYQTLQRKDCDGFENHFTQVFNSMIGPEFRHLVKLWFYENQNVETSVVQVAPSQKPVYLKLNDTERFCIRTGNIVTDLKMSEVEKYVRARWPKYE